MNTQAKILSIAMVVGALCAPAARAQVVISENFTDAATNNPWIPFLGACLTAGNNTGTVPACMTNSTTAMSYYSNQTALTGHSPLRGGYTGDLPDPVGYGALRFTNANTATTNNGFNEAGGIMSGFTYNTNAGVEVIFTTYTYEGNSGGGASDGADGMTFFMMDGGVTPFDVGAFGGSLGYTCSNANNDSKLHPDGTARGYDGLRGAVLGLGIDEYGNFLNPGDNTATGPGYVPQRIGLRGAGSITWGDLSYNPATSAYYPTSLTTSQRASAVQNTCQTGTIWNYASNPNIPTNAQSTSVVTTNTIIGPLGVPIVTTTTTYPWQQYNTGTAVLDYGAVPNGWSVLSASTKLANESASTRGAATPITYKLKIAPAANGFAVPTLSFWYNINGGAWQSVLTNQNVLTASGLSALPATVRFGFAGSSGGSNNVHEILCFQAAPAQESASSVSLNQKQTAQVQIGTQVYFASYNTTNYAGDLTANPLTTFVDGNGVTQVQINSQANWDAACVLTGGACAATGATSGTAMTPSARTILTWNPSASTPVGIPFEAANISSSENTALTAGDTGMGSPDTARLAFLRGDRSNELNVSGAGFFRDRNSVLGDIVDSSPTWVGAPSIPYPANFTDLLTTNDLGQTNTADPLYENSGQSYASFATAYASRTDVVYVGANDGLLHGHRAGSYSAGVYNNTNNDGNEVLAYAPAYVLQDIHVPGSFASEQALDFSNTNYGHNFYLDGTPGNGDVYYGGGWHSWLVGGLGAGGSAIYALNVTNPDSSSMSDPLFSESNAASLVMGEWSTTVATTVSEGTGNPAAVYYGGTGFCTGACTSSTAVVGTTLTCSGNAAGNTGSNGTLNASCGMNLGSTYGIPQIRRFHNGWWGAVFGNGSGSPTGAAGIYVMLINPSTGSSTTAPTTKFYYIQAAAGTGNGIDFVTPADLDGDHTEDYVYAGDIQGNVWRFDLTSSNPANWSVASHPLFTTAGGAAQPITSKLVVVAIPSGTSAPRILVEFGTGSQTPFTITTPTTYATGTQTLYGIWDWNMADWNAVSATQYASLGTASSPLVPISYSGNPICGSHNSCTTVNLTAQTVTSAPTASFQTQAACTGGSSGSSAPPTSSTSGSSSSTDSCTYYRTVSSNPICWDNSTQCASGNSSFGWYLDLPATQEQVIYSPALEAGAFVVNTTIPPISGSSCVITPASGYTMAISPSSGGAFTNSFFGDDNGNFVTVQGSIVSGLELNGTGTPTMVTSGVSTFLVTQTVSGSGTVVAVNPNASAQSHRLTWLEMR